MAPLERHMKGLAMSSGVVYIMILILMAQAMVVVALTLLRASRFVAKATQILGALAALSGGVGVVLYVAELRNRPGIAGATSDSFPVSLFDNLSQLPERTYDIPFFVALVLAAATLFFGVLTILEDHSVPR